MRILVATRNEGKAAEFAAVFSELGIESADRAVLDIIDEPVESGVTFAENSEIKAKAYAIASGCYAVADDSGLEVFSLDNRPGVYSARFAGENATDRENLEKLLSDLESAGLTDRTARFVCHLTLAAPDGRILFSDDGEMSGSISPKPYGLNGFGYDPIFIPVGETQTLGELPPLFKKTHSHRAKAILKLVRFLQANSIETT